MALKLPNMATVRKGTLSVDAFNDKWDILSRAFDQIHACEQANCSFQQLFQAAYQLVQQGYSAQLYEKLSAKIAEHVRAERATILKAIHQGGDAHAVLQPLVAEWDRHTITARRITDLMMNLERQYCAREKKPLIIPLSVRMFGQEVLCDDHIVTPMRETFLEAVRRDRDGEEVASTMRLHAVSKMLLDVDAADTLGGSSGTNNTTNTSSKSLFRARLETPFLAATDSYYSAESQRLLSTAAVPQYIAHYFRRLGEETGRAASCLDDSTVPRVEVILSRAFIEEHTAAIIAHETSGVHALLRAWRVEDLTALYAAFLRIRDTAPVVEATCAFFLEDGMATVTSDDNIANPVVFVEKIIEIHERMRTLLGGAYPSPRGGIDRAVEAQLLKVFTKIVNKQPFAAEYLSRLLDSKLRTNLADVDIEHASEQVMTVFAHLTDKDIFEAAYKNHLARRLLAGRTTSSEDQERIFIARLKKECGVGIASSLEGMFGDRAQSDDLMERFRERLAERGEVLPVAMHCFVLTAGFWPPPVQMQMEVPPEMDRSGKVFRMFYLGRHHGRRFDYSHANGSVDFRLTHAGRRFEINVPTMCAPVLVRFQNEEVESVEDVAKATGLSVSEAAKAVASLVRATPNNTGILALEGGSGAGISGVTRVTYNQRFKSKNLKLRVAIAVAKDRSEVGGVSRERANQQLDEDRKYKIDAAVVRIMKSRRVLDHQALVGEVVGVLSKMFSPSPDMIKRRIEHLIEREFLERSEEARNVYNYLA